MQFIPAHLVGLQELIMAGGRRLGILRTGRVIQVNPAHHVYTVAYETASGYTLRESFRFF